MTDYVLKGSEIMEDFEPCNRPNCSWCDPKGALVKVCAVDESVGGDPTTGRPMTTEDGEAGELVVKLRNLVAQLEEECERLRDALDHKNEITPNRFEPYEALDTIIERVDDIEEQLHEPRDPMACIGRLADISGEVRVLRAYITGMER